MTDVLALTLFAYAVNSGYNTKNTVDAFARVIDSSIKPNLTIDDGVHGFEKAGAVRAVNDMLLLSDRGVIKLFPADLGVDASFENLRTYGAFLVSAKYSADEGRITSASIYSETGGLVRVAKEEGMNITDSDGNPVFFNTGTLEGREDVRYVEFGTLAEKTYNLF